MADYIVTFETWQPKDGKPRDSTLRAFIARYCQKAEISLPALDAIRGEVSARVNQGRWIVDCPVQGCGNAIIASYQEPVFFCSVCGNVDNPAHWYKVVFPQEHEEIERILLERPSRNPFSALHRNWFPGEKVEDLRRENLQNNMRAKS